jgi:hypothetical protein
MSYSPRDEEPLLRIAVRRAVRRARAQATTPAFGRLLTFQATGAAGDALLAVALAGSLFFSVPEAEARGRVALYLALTVAPFAVVAPFLSRVLDRHRGSLRLAMVASAIGRGLLAWLLATRLESGLLLFPLAFGVLIFSRAALVVRGALLPSLLQDETALVQANSALSKVSALAGIAAVLPGIVLARWVSTRLELLLAAVVYAAGVIPAIRTPKSKGRRSHHERIGARRQLRSMAMRQAVVAATGLRFLVGFLVFHLAFALRREDSGSLNLGLLIASAAIGTLAGAVVAPRMKRGLREEGMLVLTTFICGVTGLFVGLYFSVPTAAVLVFVFGLCSGSAKVAFDSIVQKSTSEASRGWAFARFESILQLAWVAGALIPLVVPVPSGPGVVGSGVLATALAGIYVAGRRRARSAALP